jgi:hypothetical protein
MHPLKLSVAGRAVILCVAILAFQALTIWRWFAQDYLGATLMVTSACLFIHAVASGYQYHCRRLFVWHDRMARRGRKAAAGLRRKAELNAVCAAEATGQWAQAYYRRRAEHLPSEAERLDAEAGWHEGAARWWDFLQ